ncbi:MAG: response regulator transcription factor [Candidatus Dormibacteraeota bacterium]|nr:response regulator transcription factor [Candidatus Dormibacteraeota bacterium]
MSDPAQRATVLVVEDDRALRDSLVESLRVHEFQVAAAGDGARAVDLLLRDHFDVVLLDIGLPFVDGWHVLQTVPQPAPAVVVISARGSERDKVRALDAGADDYLAKPFGTEELLARVRAVLRRVRPPAAPPKVVTLGGVTIDLGAHTVFRDGQEVRLSPTEYGLLAELAAHAGEVMGHRTLLQHVWGPGYADERNYLRTFVQRLRRKLEEEPSNPRIVVTVGSRGYRFGDAHS